MKIGTAANVSSYVRFMKLQMMAAVWIESIKYFKFKYYIQIFEDEDVNLTWYILFKNFLKCLGSGNLFKDAVLWIRIRRIRTFLPDPDPNLNMAILIKMSIICNIM